MSYINVIHPYTAKKATLDPVKVKTSNKILNKKST